MASFYIDVLWVDLDAIGKAKSDQFGIRTDCGALFQRMEEVAVKFTP